MYNRILTTLSVIFLGSMLLASSEGISKKSINNDNVLSIENNVDLKQIESIGVSARNAIKNKLDESLIVKQGGLNKKYKDINDLHLYISELKSFKQSPSQKIKLANKINESHNLINIQSDTRDHCDAGYIDDCSGDGDCWPESWIGDGFADCQDQAYGADLTCYDCDGGDCPDSDPGCGGTAECGDGYCNGDETEASCPEDCASSGSCDDCEFDFTAYGSECCDTAWGL